MLVDEAPTGKDWVHEIKYDDYRMHARIDATIRLLTQTGQDWSIDVEKRSTYCGARGLR